MAFSYNLQLLCGNAANPEPDLEPEDDEDGSSKQQKPNKNYKANHIFGEKSLEKHKLNDFLKDFNGDQLKAYNSLEANIQNRVVKKSITGKFEETIRINRHRITVRGIVIDGKVKIGRAINPF